MSAMDETAKLALQIAQAAQSEEDLRTKMEALKVLTGFYVAANKARREHEDDGPTFGEFQKRLADIEKDEGNVN